MADVDPPNRELEARLAKDPDDEAAWQIYADWLIEQRAVRGELAALQLAYAKKRLPSRRRRVEALLEAHPELVGPKLGDVALTEYATALTWHGGFWKRMTVVPDEAEQLRHLLQHRSAKLLKSLKVPTGEIDQSGIARAIAAAGSLPALRRLTLGDVPEYGQSDVGSELERRTCIGMGALPAVLPNLRSLFLCIFEHFDFASFPRLRKLRVASLPIARESLRAVLTADLPKLTQLELIIGSGMDSEGGSTPLNVSVADFAPLLEGMHVPRLKTLAIHLAFAEESEGPSGDAAFTTELRQALASAPIAKRLAHFTVEEGAPL